MYVCDYRHDPRAHRCPPDFPRSALRLWDYFGSIVQGASATWGGVVPRRIALRCRRRPDRRPCPGWIEVFPASGERLEGTLVWTCPRCGDAGSLSHWRGSEDDLSLIAVRGEDSTDPDAWCAALVTPDEYRALTEIDLGEHSFVRRILRAARPTRPGIRIEGPRGPWQQMSVVVHDALRPMRASRKRRRIEAAQGRLEDGLRIW
jgi:hypothetical protein